MRKEEVAREWDWEEEWKWKREREKEGQWEREREWEWIWEREWESRGSEGNEIGSGLSTDSRWDSNDAREGSARHQLDSQVAMLL